jgi:hypothetical protein
MKRITPEARELAFRVYALFGGRNIPSFHKVIRDP